MQFIHMDVDRYQSQDRCQLGPLSPGLNAICGPKGSGKTALLNWLRLVAAEGLDAAERGLAEGLLGDVASVSGKLTVRDGRDEYTLASDRRGRITCGDPEYAYRRWESLGFDQRDHGVPTKFPFSRLQRRVFAGLSAACGRADSESALVRLACELELSTGPSQATSKRREQLVAQEQDLLRQLNDLPEAAASDSELDQQRLALEAELEKRREAREENERRHGAEYDELRLQKRALQDELDAGISKLQALESKLQPFDGRSRSASPSSPETQVGVKYRIQLRELDQRLQQWRQTLRDIRARRAQIEHQATDSRLDQQLGDQLSGASQSTPREPLRSLEAHLLQTQKRLDELVAEYAQTPRSHPSEDDSELARKFNPASQEPTGYRVVRNSDGTTHLTYVDPPATTPDSRNLPAVLREMQRDLQRVCQQIARQEALATVSGLREQSEQLERCETELLHSVEKLIDERTQLLQRIAGECQLSHEQLHLAFGEWCTCHDHPRLQDWLLNSDDSSAGCTSNAENSAVGARAIAETEQQRKDLEFELNDVRRKLKKADDRLLQWSANAIASDRSSEQKLESELQAVVERQRTAECRERLKRELSDVRSKLSSEAHVGNSDRFHQEVDKHIIGLMGAEQSDEWSLETSQATNRGAPVVSHDFGDRELRVPAALVKAAMRTAIARAAGRRGQPVPLVFDESFDDLSPAHQRSAIRYVASLAHNDQQILILTSDEAIVNLVRSHQGHVDYLRATGAAVRDSSDVNRQLAAVANAHEAEKWGCPTSQQPSASRSAQREYYLTERSLIEESPSIDPTTAARCRALGIDRIGDLLDCDPVWLAEHLGLDGVTTAMVSRWQAEARLLCGVRWLRPFDARVLVGSGVRSPSQLSDMHPSRLLDRVEAFLATREGQSILRSGTSFELSRITSWIAAANGNTSRYHRTSFEGFEEEAATGRAINSRRGKRGDRRLPKASRGGKQRAGGSRQGSRNAVVRTSGRVQKNGGPSQGPHPYTVVGRTEEAYQAHQGTSAAEPDQGDESSDHVRFYLELASPVVDAPSIGPKMAARLEQQGIHTVDQLLAADPEWLADKLDLRRVDADRVLRWQDQARLVCRIPNLRGHDAQLLVACDFTSPEELASMDPAALLDEVLVIARSKAGERILRGSREPDLQEVTNWIAWSASCRQLNAA